MSGRIGKKASNYDIYNKGCDFEIEALFIRNWCEIKQLLYKHMNKACLFARR